ncbi:SCAN domain-containing protein 3-like [Phlebotomus papatasi]|uniref:SCAN domain-containing protein 3-like n=1 Tax=Phlebotomus papatasi TaxID=29031 RepID=UPI0024835088|nr:SCAN domain-containing protein 3-like [Phlebotomus papatasi]
MDFAKARQNDFYFERFANRLVWQCNICGQRMKVRGEDRPYRLAKHWRENHKSQCRNETENPSSSLGCEEGIETGDVKNPSTHLDLSDPVTLLSYRCALGEKSYSDVSFWRDNIADVLDLMGESSAAERLRRLPLSRFTIGRRVEELGTILDDDLHEKLAKCSYFSLCLDESIDRTDACHLMIFVRGILPDWSIFEQMLDLKQLIKTTGKDVFTAVQEALCIAGGENLKEKLVAITTDGAAAMKGPLKGFRGRMVREMPYLQHFHCILHEEVLCAKTLSLQKTMDKVIKIINRLRGGKNSQTHRLLRDFLENNGAEFRDLLLYTDIRWLSKAAALERFFRLRHLIVMFVSMEQISFNDDILEDLQDGSTSFWEEVAFLCDITGHLNKLNLQLQISGYFSLDFLELKMKVI